MKEYKYYTIELSSGHSFSVATEYDLIILLAEGPNFGSRPPFLSFTIAFDDTVEGIEMAKQYKFTPMAVGISYIVSVREIFGAAATFERARNKELNAEA